MKKLFVVLLIALSACSEDVVEPEQKLCYECVTKFTNYNLNAYHNGLYKDLNLPIDGVTDLVNGSNTLFCGVEKEVGRIEEEGTYDIELTDPNSARYIIEVKTRCYRDY